MTQVRIKVMKSGPYLVEGPVELVDHAGGRFEVPSAKAVALCRCGQSARRPFCDGTHSRCGFQSEETASS